MAPLGHEPETRPFHAHLTLGRLKVPADVRDRLGPAAAVGVGRVGREWPVGEVVVYESRLRPSGAEYATRAAIPLRGA